MQNTTPLWLRRFAIPALALAIVLALVVYSAGFDTVLRLLTSRAGTIGTLELSSEDQLMGADDGTDWLVVGSQPVQEGTSIFTSFTDIPDDPGQSGFVAPIYSAEDPAENTITEHIFVTPAIDLSASVIVESIGVEYYQPAGNELRHSYRSAETLAELDSASFQSLDLSVVSGVEGEVQTAIQSLASVMPRYLQLRVEFDEDNFAQRSAVYGWQIQTSAIAADPADDITGGDSGTNGDPIQNDDPAPATDQDSEVELRISWDTEQALPVPLTLKLVAASDFGRTALVEETITTQAEEEDLVLDAQLAPGAYGLVATGPQFVSQFVPFAVGGATTSVSLPLDTFVPVLSMGSTFDLNGDGAVNSLDIARLLQEINQQ